MNERETPAPDSRDWFAPPLDQPTEPPYMPPPPQPPSIPIPGTLRPTGDRRVWPEPAPDEDTSTVPFPAIPGTRNELPAHYRRPSAQVPPPAGPRKRMSRGRRRVLLAGGAVVSVALAVALPAWFGYGVYKYGRPSDHIHSVPAGQAGTWQHVSWRVSVERIPNPDPKAASDTTRQWMKIVATRTALDAEGAIRHYPPEIELTDASGRTWVTQVLNDATPLDTDKNKVGTPYKIELVGVVPPPVADTVDVLLRPSISRDVPGKKFDLKESVTNPERNDQVLKFLR
ncbi:hypothetical protein Pth03_59140 [Planotetraspora thailandica]|uniref:Uncharacterized protein n=1 Tax=Planotetraspora thailandica TaxID=487172 RepID=A0A8J3VFG9_9ACTN|nr:hypothetical protein [Planotetraspora thailandica]GII57525.1 hypothetical protein Pth03_59140 [Planotetraspora thailandica]